MQSANTRVSRAIAAFEGRTLYIPANRSPVFQPTNSYQRISQADTSNMGPLLLGLNVTNRAAFDGLSGALSLLFPDVRRLQMGPCGDAVMPELEFVDGRTEYVSNMGFGFQNAVHILTVLILAPPAAVLVIDEPEKGLNQSVQMDFAALLEALRPDVTLLVATQAESFCRGFSSSSSILLVEALGDKSVVSKLHIAEHEADVRRLAQAMGLDPVYLSEGGKIIYVEGISDKLIVERWLDLVLGPAIDGFEVVALGGCGNIGQEFVKPLLRAFKNSVFVLLDSDRTSQEERCSEAIAKLVNWLKSHGVDNHYVLEKRELENYLGPELIAEVADMRSSALKAVPGHEDWHDIKAAFLKQKGFAYEERRLSVGAFDRLNADAQRRIFLEETGTILEKIRAFLGIN
jgi:hypothetical protein